MQTGTSEKKTARRGHYAKRLGTTARFVQVDAEVWEAFDGDTAAIEDALRRLAAIVRANKHTRRKAR